MAGTAGISEVFAILCHQTAAGADVIAYTMLRGAICQDMSSAAAASAGASRVIVQTNIAGAGLVNLTTSVTPAANTVVRTTAMVSAQKALAAADVVSFNHTDGATMTRTTVLCTAPAVPATI